MDSTKWYFRWLKSWPWSLQNVQGGCTESDHLLELKLYWCHVVMYRNHPEGCSCELFLCPGLVTPVLCLIYLKIPLAPAFCKLFLSQIRGHYPQPNFEGDYTYTYLYLYLYLYIYLLNTHWRLGGFVEVLLLDLGDSWVLASLMRMIPHAGFVA